jgi:glycopeptide antibiotics resistance protein
MASRQFFADSLFVKTYVGDALWALMVFFGFGFTFTRWPTQTVALAAFIFSFGIEISQLYHAPWLDSLRATRAGGLILGFTFVWSDLVCYTVGIAVGVVIDKFLLPARWQHRPKSLHPTQ